MTVRSNKEIIKGMREIVKPFIGDFLKRENYEGMGDVDKAEFEAEFEKVLTLAEKAEPLSETFKKVSAEIREAREDLDGYDPNALITFADRVDDIIEKYREPKEEKGTGCTSTHNVLKR